MSRSVFSYLCLLGLLSYCFFLQFWLLVWFLNGIMVVSIDYMWTGVLLRVPGILSTDRWPIMWIMMEINLISFLPLISTQWSIKKISILYFLVQRVGSLSLLIRGILTDKSTIMRKWLILGLLLKARLAPFHFWGAPMIVNMSKSLALVFLTWQKIAPMILLLVLPKMSWVVLLNIIVAARCRVGTKNILVLLFFSGLIHMSWVLTSPCNMSIKYYAFYTLVTSPILLLTYHPLLIMNLAGLPPLTGFFIKLNVLQIIRLRRGIILLIFSIILLYAYMRLFLLTPKHKPLTITTVLPCCLGIVF